MGVGTRGAGGAVAPLNKLQKVFKFKPKSSSYTYMQRISLRALAHSGVQTIFSGPFSLVKSDSILLVEG